MGKKRKGKTRDPGGDTPTPTTGKKPPAPPSGFKRWLRANWSDLKFLFVFGLCLGIYFLATLTSPVKDGFFPAYLRWNARTSGTILNGIGEKVTVEGKSIKSAKGPAIDIARGCDAVEPSALFVAAVIASPVPILARLSAAVVGTMLLMLLNLVRVVTLFLCRVYWPKAFETMHLDVWQAVFIILAILLWAGWASRMARRRTVKADAST